jgi:hypothetical protein
MAWLRDLAEEQSTYPVVVACLDETGAPVVPNDWRWTLLKPNGDIVNGREDVTLTPAFEMTVLLFADDLAVEDGETRTRTLLVEGSYDSDLGNDLPLRDSVNFRIKDLKGVA